MPRTPKRMWTIGYEGHSPESFVMKLRGAGVQRVVDVRELPLSRRAGFSKTALAMGLSKADIAYSHVKALGTPRPVRHAYKAGGSFEEFREAYLDHVAGHAPVVQELEETAARERVALLCVEHDVATCHRGVLAELLAARGWTFEHL